MDTKNSGNQKNNNLSHKSGAKITLMAEEPHFHSALESPYSSRGAMSDYYYSIEPLYVETMAIGYAK